MNNSSATTEPKKENEPALKDGETINKDGKKVSSSDLNLNDESTLQTPEEHEEDKNTDPTKDDTIEVSK